MLLPAQVGLQTTLEAGRKGPLGQEHPELPTSGGLLHWPKSWGVHKGPPKGWHPQSRRQGLELGRSTEPQSWGLSHGNKEGRSGKNCPDASGLKTATRRTPGSKLAIKNAGKFQLGGDSRAMLLQLRKDRKEASRETQNHRQKRPSLEDTKSGFSQWCRSFYFDPLLNQTISFSYKRQEVC